MGTSARYDAPPAWGPLKSAVTRTGGTPLSALSVQNLISNHIGANGGSSAIASGGGGVLGSGRTPQQVANRLGRFLGQVGSVGVREALERSGLGSYVGREANDVILALIGLCGVEDGSIDSVDARNAMSRLLDEMLANAQTPTEVEEILTQKSDLTSIKNLMVKFFGYYLYEQFCRVFFEQLVQKHGDDRAASFLVQIRDYIGSSLLDHTIGQDVSRIDWDGPEADQMADRILRETLDVFSV
jgi:hypothetical protein